jgi:prepilin-type N-terminal cleavage/methylation domain-containing protein
VNANFLNNKGQSMGKASAQRTENAVRTCRPGAFVEASSAEPPVEKQAFSLIEVLVTIALLTLIILGLFSMFNMVQKAFRSSLTQTDVLEGGRAAAELVVRDIEQLRPAYRSNAANFYTQIPFSVPLMQGLPGNTPQVQRTNIVEDFFMLRRENQTWYGIGYFVRTNDVSGLLWLPETLSGSPGKMGAGTLYRLLVSTTNIYQDPSDLYAAFLRARAPGITYMTNVNRIADGVVDFRFRAFDTNGALITTNIPHRTLLNTDIRYSTVVPGEIGLYTFFSNAVPVSVEMQMGMLEQANWQHLKAMTTPDSMHNYLSNHAGQVHLFRRRIPIASVDFKAYQ